MPTVGDICAHLDSRAPRPTAERWDNVGLLLGDPSWETKGVVVDDDLSAAALDRARQKGYRLIVNHHPCIFPREPGLSRVTPAHELVFRALAEGVAVYAAHTNFDVCALEVPQAVARGLELEIKGRLIDRAPSLSLLRARGEPVNMLKEWALRIDQADGRYEAVLPTGLRNRIQGQLRKADADWDWIDGVQWDPVALTKGVRRGVGYGFWGEFAAAKPFQEVERYVKRLFILDGYWISGDTPEVIRRVGFVAGKGSSFLASAQSVGCDLLITGEAGYHSSLDGGRSGTPVMEIGHRESEKFFLQTMRDWLDGFGLQTEVLFDERTQKVMC